MRVVGLKDRIASQASRVASTAASTAASAAASAKGAASAAAQERIARSDKAAARLIELFRMRDDQPVAVETMLVILVDACHADDAPELTDRDVKKAGKRRQRVAGLAGAVGGPVGIQLASLYCEVEILCDVVHRHRLELTEEEIAAHLLVLWNVVPDLEIAKHAIDGTGDSLAARMTGAVRGKVAEHSPKGRTKKEVVRMLWQMRNVTDEVQLPGSANVRDVVLPGRRVKAVTQAAERQLGVAT
jgi:hypothetical protein